MYFDTNEVNNVLICTNCEGKLDIAKILPCGETICSFCSSSIQLINENKFECLICKEKHEMPKNGLSNNKALLKMLSIKSTRVSRGKAFDSLQKLFEDIQKKHGLIKLGIENSIDFVKEYCIDLRSDVQLKTEEAIQQINDISSKIIDEIDKYEEELIEFNKMNSKSLDRFNNIAKELESFLNFNKEYLKQHNVDDEIVIKLNEEANSLINKAEIEIQNLKDVIFDGKLLRFHKSSKPITKSFLGITKVIHTEMDSLILFGRNQFEYLMNLCEFSITQTWNLIYRASRDGFKAKDFHSFCDCKSNTFVIIKSEHGNVFGGYTEQDWTPNDNIMKSDLNSFIFSLINKENKPIKLKCLNAEKAIYGGTDYGPTFGYGPVIRIHNNSNMNTNSLSKLGITGSVYKHPEYVENSTEAKSFLAGSEEFKVLEIEVHMKK